MKVFPACAFVSLFFCVNLVFSQNDTLSKRLDEIVVPAKNPEKTTTAIAPLQLFDNELIAELPVVQLSDVLKYFSGIVIKDYGGVGGLKTVSVRGFGTHHTAVAYDGISISDCQTGQIDLSKLPLNNLKSVSLVTGSVSDIFIPARLSASASLIMLKSEIPYFDTQQAVKVKCNFTVGSYGLLNPSLLVENRLIKKKSGATLLSSSFYVSYLQSKGNYPFTIYYGGLNDSTSSERRSNSDVRTISTEANLFFNFNTRSLLHFKLFYFHSQRGLPGAVIYYNTNSTQRLWDENLFGQLHYQNLFSAKISYQFNAKIAYSFQRYLDSEYLNAMGFLDNRYFQREFYVSNVLLYKPFKNLSFSLSNDLIYNNLNSNITDAVKPNRFSSLTALELLFDSKYLDLQAGLLHTYVLNRVDSGASANNINNFAPSLGLSLRPILKEEFFVRIFYKNIFRMPSFNDLYYKEVGNVNLNPEKTYQLNLGVTFDKSIIIDKLSLKGSVDGYYNQVKDKIVAIPNKNLFIWSMINYGRVAISGIDANFTLYTQPIDVLSIYITGNYTLQHAIDITDESSKTYRHQIPYTPLHSGAAGLTFKMKWLTLTYSMIMSGKRYALLQNIAANELPSYIDHSIVISKDFQVKKCNLGLKLELLNLTNKHYEIIRNYPMQGRSFRVSLAFKY